LIANNTNTYRPDRRERERANDKKAADLRQSPIDAHETHTQKPPSNNAPARAAFTASGTNTDPNDDRKPQAQKPADNTPAEAQRIQTTATRNASRLLR
jgi:hypothetical protein